MGWTWTWELLGMDVHGFPGILRVKTWYLRRVGSICQKRWLKRLQILWGLGKIKVKIDWGCKLVWCLWEVDGHVVLMICQCKSMFAKKSKWLFWNNNSEKIVVSIYFELFILSGQSLYSSVSQLKGWGKGNCGLCIAKFVLTLQLKNGRDGYKLRSYVTRKLKIPWLRDAMGKHLRYLLGCVYHLTK